MIFKDSNSNNLIVLSILKIIEIFLIETVQTLQFRIFNGLCRTFEFLPDLVACFSLNSFNGLMMKCGASTYAI